MTTTLDRVYTLLEYGLANTSLGGVCTVLGYGLVEPRLLVVFLLYWCTDKTTTCLGRVFTVLVYGLDDHVSW